MKKKNANSVHAYVNLAIENTDLVWNKHQNRDNCMYVWCFCSLQTSHNESHAVVNNKLTYGLRFPTCFSNFLFYILHSNKFDNFILSFDWIFFYANHAMQRMTITEDNQI